MKDMIIGLWVAAAAVVAIATPATAQNAGGGSAGKVAYVNIQEILKKTPEYAQAESTYNKEFEVFQKEGQKLRTRIDSLASDFERQSTMLNATQRATKRQELEEEGKKAEQSFREAQQKITLRERELLEPIQRRVNAVIEGERAAGGYAIIFDVSAPNSGIVVADTSLDLTQKIIARLTTSR